MEDRKKTRPIRTPVGALVRGVLLIAVDVFLINQGIVSLFIGLWVLLVSLPIVVFSKRYEGNRRTGLATIGIYIGAILCVLFLNATMNEMARNRAENLVEAIKTYRSDKGQYPAQLEDLVPGYIDRVPLAKYALASSSFMYRSEEDFTILMYTLFPPFIRPFFYFERDKWEYFD